MKIFSKKPLIVWFTILLTGCSTVGGQRIVEVVDSRPSQEALRLLSEITEIKRELRQLRNSVEEVQFDNEQAKRRQRDLFEDLDRRMITLERSRAALLYEPATVQTDDKKNLLATDETENQLEIVPQTQQPKTIDTNAVVDSLENPQGDTMTAPTVITQPADNSEPPSPTQTAVGLQEQQSYELGFDLLKQSRYEESTAQFQNFIDTWPTSALVDNAYYWMSEARYVNREFAQALVGFRTIIQQYPESQRVPESMLKVGYIQYDVGAYDEAAKTFRDVIQRFPEHQVAVSAQTRLRRIEQTIQ